MATQSDPVREAESAGVLIGAFAGSLATLAFTVVHQFMISNIWFMFIPMLIAGALSGIAIVWSYNLMVPHPSIQTWARYNLILVALLYLMTPISLLLYDPIITIQALLASPSGLPDHLVQIVTPFAAIYTIIMFIAIVVLHKWQWKYLLAAFVTSAILMLLLGLNIAPFGLVYLGSGWEILMLEQIALILVLNAIFASTYWIIRYRARKWKILTSQNG